MVNSLPHIIYLKTRKS